MKFLKYLIAILSALLALSLVLPAWLIVSGLVTGNVDDPIYFLIKLVLYFAMLAIMILISVKSFKSARGMS